ncbi:MAG TPA: hypothetical protein VMV69_08825 [Pirellulales bacterium]|nr:hypothetical protein [Pirellulales bacterium]
MLKIIRWPLLTLGRLFKRWADASLAGHVESIKQELSETVSALKVAEEENRRLWAVSKRDHARVEQESSLYARGRAEALAAITAAKEG